MEDMIRLLRAFDRALNDKAYMRRLVVRAIEDAIALFILGITTAAICSVASLALRLLGVG